MKIEFAVIEDDLGKIVTIHESVGDEAIDALIDKLTDTRFRSDTVRYRRVDALTEGTIESIEV